MGPPGVTRVVTRESASTRQRTHVPHRVRLKNYVDRGQRTEGHGFYAEPHLVEMYEQVIALLDEQIGEKRNKETTTQ